MVEFENYFSDLSIRKMWRDVKLAVSKIFCWENFPEKFYLDFQRIFGEKGEIVFGKSEKRKGRINAMKNGISIYPGLDGTIEENLALMERAAAAGIKRVFTSLHIPESDENAMKKDLGRIIKSAREKKMEVIADTTPQTMRLFGMSEFSLSTFRMLGIETIRLDADYEAKEIAALSRNRQNIRIQLNASTITGNFLTKLMEAKTNFKNVDALHNFYPRPGTGLGEETLVRKTLMLHKFGISVGAFVPGEKHKRGPLFDGLPTMEDHRDMGVDLAARHLVALGVDSVFIGDGLPGDEEIAALGKLKSDKVVLNAELFTADPVQKELLNHDFTARMDEARDAVRAEESRRLVSNPIFPENPVQRNPGDITIDNEQYLRYMGELEIIKIGQAADERVNVAGRIAPNETFLIDYITPGRKFSFKFQNSPRK